jgi:hypothetical protein
MKHKELLTRLAEKAVKDLTREDLIAICEAAVVPEKHWHDRDSQAAHVQVGQAWALLGADCHYKLRLRRDDKEDRCVTDSDTIWLDIWSKGFTYFEWGEDSTNPKVGREHDTIYLPTPKRLLAANGKDWY